MCVCWTFFQRDRIGRILQCHNRQQRLSLDHLLCLIILLAFCIIIIIIFFFFYYCEKKNKKKKGKKIRNLIKWKSCSSNFLMFSRQNFSLCTGVHSNFSALISLTYFSNDDRIRRFFSRIYPTYSKSSNKS